MSLSELIQKLADANIKIRLSDNSLAIDAPSQVVEPGLLDQIMNYEEMLIELLGVEEVPATISPVPESASYALSHAQRRLWILHQLEDVKYVYNVPMILELDHQMDVAALSAAFDLLVQRHEILRTKFILVNGEPRQLIATDELPLLQYHDLRAEALRYEMLKQDMDEKMHHTFDLTSGHLIIAELFRLEEEKFIFLLNMHHIICDARSVEIIKEELLSFYQSGIYADLPALAIQYKDFAAWHNQQLEGEGIRPHRDYWLNIFSGEIPVLNLSTDMPWPNEKTYNGMAYEVILPDALAAGLRELAQLHNTSAFILFIALVKTLLYKYTGQSDIITGTVTEGRFDEELESQLGFYINTLPLRIAFSEEEDFVQLLDKVKQSLLGAIDHQIYPFDLLVDDLDLRHESGRNPLFDVMISHLQVDGSIAYESEVEDPFGVKLSGSKFSLSFALLDNTDKLKLHIGFNTDLYKDDTINRMLANLQTLAAAVIANKQLPLKELSYIAKEEQQLILHDFNNTSLPFDDKITLQGLFIQQAALTPTAIALISEQEEWSYQYLNERVNKLTYLLRITYGVKPGMLVGVMMEHSFKLIETLLAVLKCGAAYVPILHEYPAERASYMLDDTALEILITDKNVNFPQLLVINLQEVHYDTLPAEEPVLAYSSDDLACLLYTSGSTGNPKGVMVPHKGLINRISWLWEKAAFTADDIYLLKTTYAFDVSIGEIFMTLGYGARLFIPGKTFAGIPHETAEYIKQYNVTTIHFSPSLLNLFLHALPADAYREMTTLRHVMASGEALMPETVKEFYTKFDIPLYNLYGPTEASVEVCYYETKRGDEIIPIGKPIPNVRMRILDRFNRIVPVGVQGEICIGGVALANGYLNRDQETAARFIPDPYGAAGERLYRTGDIGRWLSDGNIEFLGRRDNQVSLGGYRMELGEIESALCGHEDVKNAVVIPWTDKSGDAGLVAYIEKASLLPEWQEETGTESYLLSEADKLFLDNVNNTGKQYAAHNTFVAVFEEVVAKYPLRTAIIAENRQLSYYELNERVNRLAALLSQRYDLGRGQTAAVWMTRSEQLLVAILAIIKTGAAYVPVDEDCPEERVKYIAADCGVRLLLTDIKEHRLTGIELLDMEHVSAHMRQFSSSNVKRAISTSDLAYIIYTSGSTGKPKGVKVNHGNLYNVAMAWRDCYQLETFKIVLLQMASVAFDVFTGDLCRALLNGGKLVICPAEVLVDPAYASQLILQYKVNVIESTPSLLIPLLGYITDNDLDISFMRLLIFGSEMMLMKEFSNVTAQFGKHTRIINSYGTTETTIDTSVYEAIEGQLPDCAHAPIGKPLANMGFYILDETQQLLGPGKTGELYIAGAGVSQGYIHQPELTAKSFVPDPFIPGNTMYKTGDRARWLPSGDVELTGRIDHQLKLRGYRIEPGEIENVLLSYPGISRAIVLIREDDAGTPYLVAYYTAEKAISIHECRAFLKTLLPVYMIPAFFIRVTAFTLTSNGKINRNTLPDPVFNSNSVQLRLREYLLGKLPKYMVPSTYIMLNTMPRTVSGKLDRRALPDPEELMLTSEREYIAASGELETTMVEIWEELLNRTNIGVEDDFFDLGGHSLKAVRLVSLAHRRTGMTDISIKDLYDWPTIRSLCAVIQGKKTGSPLLLTFNRKIPGRQNLFFIPPVLGTSTIFRQLAVKLEGKANCYGMLMRGFDSAESFDMSIAEMAAGFVSEIRRVQPSGDIQLMGYSMGCLVAFEMAALLEESGVNVKLLLLDSPVAATTVALPEPPVLSAEFERQVTIAFPGLTATEIAKLEKIFLHNMSLVHQYTMKHLIRATITAVEALNGIRQPCMEQWAAYSSGSFNYQVMHADHYAAIYDDGLPAIVAAFLSK
jgi:amino acid adenylation domain-containing protein